MAAPARADDASAWDSDSRSAMRLIAGNVERGTSGLVLRAGVEVKLNRNWKTYWRYPGDSGVPPRFDFSASTNVKSVAVAWPAPHRFSDESGDSIGYKDDVIFPLRIVPQDDKQPVTLRLKIDYAVCEKLCVPAQGTAELALAGTPSLLESTLAAAEATVPKPVPLGQGAMISIKSVKRGSGAQDQTVFVEVAAPENLSIDLFAEGPAPDWALPLPTPLGGTPTGLLRFKFILDGLPPGVSAKGATLTLTLVGGSAAVESKVRLD